MLAALSRDRGARLPSAAHLGGYLEELGMRHGLLVGPRAIARYFSSVAPAEPIREEALGIVEADPPRLEVVPDSEARRVWGPPDDDLPDIDEKEVLDDLQLLAIPNDAYPGDDEGIDLADAVEELDSLLEAPEEQPGEAFLSLDSSSLVLDGFNEDGPRERPVVLLDERSRKDPTGRTSRKKGDYVDELERRLAGEPSDD